VSSVVVLACSPLQDDLVNRTFLLGTFRTLSLGSNTLPKKGFSTLDSPATLD
jgi:hypothetical protein